MNTLSFPLSNQLLLVVAPHAARQSSLLLAARIAARGPLTVLDGGNQFNAYPVARAIRRLTPDLSLALERIRLSRAFTCYQLAALLAETLPNGSPVMALDFLATFYDQDVQLPEAGRLLQVCIRDLQRLSRSAPVIATARPPSTACAERWPLLDTLRAAASEVWEMAEDGTPTLAAPTLFQLGGY